MNLFRLNSTIYDELLKELCNGIDFTTKASIIPNTSKLDSLINYGMANTNKLSIICTNIEKRFLRTLPNGYINALSDMTSILMKVTLYSIRECTFYVNIFRAFVNKCKSIGILHYISDIINRVIIKLLQQSHEEYLKLFYPLCIDFLYINDFIDYTSLIEPILSICYDNILIQTTLPLKERQRLGFNALAKLINVSRSHQGHLEIYYNQLFTFLVDHISLESFRRIDSLTVVNDQSFEASSLSDTCLQCFRYLVSSPSPTSIKALINTMIFYFDSRDWHDKELAIQLFLVLDLTVYLDRRIVSNAVPSLISHANFIATTELAEKISKAEDIKKKSRMKLVSNLNTIQFEPDRSSAEVVESILIITTEIIILEMTKLSSESYSHVDIQNYRNQCELPKNLYTLTHLIWMCIVWKTFHSNKKGSIQPHDILLSEIQYNNNVPRLCLLQPEENVVQLSNQGSETDTNIHSVSTNTMTGILTQIWKCLDALVLYQFPTTKAKYQILPSLFKVIHEKVHNLLDTPGVRIDLLIPAKNAMFTYILHAMLRILSHRSVELVRSVIDDESCIVTSEIICDMALLLQSKSWQTQSLAMKVLYELFAAINESAVYDEMSVPEQPGSPKKLTTLISPSRILSKQGDLNMKSLSSSERKSNNPWAPFNRKYMAIIRDAIFNALCTSFPYQSHTVAGLYQLQTVLITSFGEEEILESLPVILALEEFWTVYGTAHGQKSPSNESRLSMEVGKSIVPFEGSIDHPDSTAVAMMLSCQRLYYLGYFLLISKYYRNKVLEEYIREIFNCWYDNKSLPQDMDLEFASGMIMIVDPSKSMKSSSSSISSSKSAINERININDLLSILVNNIESTVLVDKIRTAFETPYFPVEDPFMRLEDTQYTQIPKALFKD